MTFGNRICSVRFKSLVLPTLVASIVLIIALALRPHPSHAGSGISRTIASGAVTVKIQNYAYLPASITVRAGTRVTWKNLDQTAHTATADSGSFDTGTINPGHSKTTAFKRPGTFTYHCAFHAFMTGTIKVVS